jgi:uncharacterized protein (DUF885 family)
MHIRFFVIAVGFVTLLGAPAALKPNSDATYAALAKAYFAESFRASPVSATQIGIHDYDATVGSYDAAAYAAQIARDHRYLNRLATIDRATMSRRGALDYAMLENALHDDLLLNETMQLWKHHPDSYVQTASNGVFALISRNFAPPSVRLSDVIARENQISRLYAQARENLTTVDKDTAEIALDDANGSIDLFTKTVPRALAGVGDATTRTRFRRSTVAAVLATRDFARYLKTHFIVHPSGTYAIGAANYSARLKYEEGIDIPLDRYLAIGEKALAQTHAAMVATAKQIDPHATTEQVLARLYKVHPTSANLLSAAQGDLVRLRTFIIAHHIIDLPATANIKVTETPEFLRATTEASMDSPGPLERVATQAYYNVTPVNPHDPPAVQEQYLEAFNDYERPIISAHEVYPGHYTNFVIDKQLPLTLTEKLLTATSFVEGWAHYDEQMMVDEGWGNRDPRVRLMQLREAIWRNARFVAGVKLHTQGMTVPQAIQLFEKRAFLDPASARAEARRGTQDATYGYYTLGKLAIFKLRDDYKKKMGSAYTLARFHHDLLQYGDPAIPLLRPLLLGTADDEKVLPDM